MTSPLIHIGYPKTGTTWLQKHVFSNTSLGFRRVDTALVRQQFVEANLFDFDPNDCRQRLAAELAAAHREGCLPVLSYERLSGHTFFGGYDARLIADRLHEVYPRGKVLLVIREQRAMIYSGYQQYVRGGGVLGLRDYLCPPCRPRRMAPRFTLEHYAYHRQILHYQRLFGPANVLVLPMEQLRAEPVRFVEEIGRFARVDLAPEALGALPFSERTNAGMTPLAVAVVRWLHRLFARTEFSPAPLLPLPGTSYRTANRLGDLLARLAPAFLHHRFEERVRALVASVVQDTYQASNEYTSRLIGIDLASYGYACAELQGTLVVPEPMRRAA